MTDHMQTIRDDLAFLRALAEEGRESGGRGGAALLAAGLIFSACSVLQWAAVEGLIGQTVATFAEKAGTALFLLFLLTLWVIHARSAAAGRSRIASVAWQGVGLSVLTLIVTLAVATWRIQSPILTYLLPSIIFALYGAAWTVAAVISGRVWIRLTAAGSYLAAVACAFVITQPIQCLVFAAGLLLLGALPGFVLLRQGGQTAA
jgi:hypothetical protein